MRKNRCAPFWALLNGHVHFHCIITEGVFSDGPNEEARFYEVASLDTQDIEAVQEKTRHCVLRWLERHGYLDPDALEMMRAWPHSGGFSLDASVCLHDWDRGGLECLARYCARPAFSAERSACRGIRAPGPVE